MPLINSWFFTKTIIKWDLIEKATHNQYRVVSVRLYEDKKDILPDGLILSLMVIKDSFDYGVDKNGNPRENNEYQTFDATVLTRKHNIQKGDIVQLLDFDEEHSFAIGFDLLLRFRDAKILQSKANAQKKDT